MDDGPDSSPVNPAPVVAQSKATGGFPSCDRGHIAARGLFTGTSSARTQAATRSRRSNAKCPGDGPGRDRDHVQRPLRARPGSADRRSDHLHRIIDSRRVSIKGEARWNAPDPESESAYLEFNLDEISDNKASALTNTTRDEQGVSASPRQVTASS